MRYWIAFALVAAGCRHDGDVVHTAEVFCHQRANEWARLADDYRARAGLAPPGELAAREADATYGILAPDARRVWASAASSSFALCLDIRAIAPARAHELEAAFAAAHDPFLQGPPDLAIGANELAAMASVLHDLNQLPARD